MEFATQIGPLPYSWRIVSGIPLDELVVRAQIEIADAAGTIHAVPDQDGNPAATFAIDIPFDPTVDSQGLIDQQYAVVRNRLWTTEAGGPAQAFAQVVAQGYRRPL